MNPSPTSPPRRAIIIGGSMAGLFTALLLRRIGWQADIFERVAGELSSRGAGIVTHTELFHALELAGLPTDPSEIGVSVIGRRVLARDGRVAAETPFPQVLTSWGRLYDLLRTALPPGHYHQGRSLERIATTGDAVTACFSDAPVEQAGLLIGADGINSTVRAALLPDVRPQYAGYVAWRGLVEEAALSPACRDALCNHFSFCLPPGEQMLGYPVAGAGESTAPGHRRYNFVWYRPAAQGAALDELLTDIDGITHAMSIPPNRIRPEVIAAMRADADRLLAPQFAEVVRQTTQPFLQAILDLDSPTMVPHRRVALLGDAAFVARPHVGMGVTKAAGDAMALARALESHPDDLDAALASFEHERRAVGAAVVQRARQLGAYMQAQIRTEAERAAAERHRSPAAIMAETAATFSAA